MNNNRMWGPVGLEDVRTGKKILGLFLYFLPEQHLEILPFLSLPYHKKRQDFLKEMVSRLFCGSISEFLGQGCNQ